MERQEIENFDDDILNSINLNSRFNPIQMSPSDGPVNVLKCRNGYWVSLGDGEFVNDLEGNKVILSKEEVRIGRARYLTNFKEEILEKKIQLEVSRLKKDVDKHLDNTLSKLKDILVYSGHIELKGLNKTFHEISNKNNPELYELREKQAKTVATPELIEYYEWLNSLKKEENYNSLYCHLFESNLPRVATFDNDSKVLIDHFHKDKIEETIKDLNDHEYLYNVAKFNVLNSNKV